MTVFLPVECPYCHSTDIAKHGKSSYNGKTRYRCCNADCPHLTFSLKLDYPGRNPQVKKQILEMTFNGSGVRDISRTLGVSTSTVIKELKKNPQPLNPSIPNS
ncbi:IS1-like element transposase [Aphanothece hegewaldii]|uniref:IS1-like element transposase n=1 Tax=Aphanothece hegewaldii TaxID=1521625 RepID=UPI001C63A666